MRVTHRRAAEIERNLLGAVVQRDRRDVETHRRRVAADAKEQIADHRGSLELRKVRRRNRSRHTVDRVRLPAWATGIDIGPQLGVEKSVDQAARRKQPGKIVQRDFTARALDKRVAAVDRLLAQRGRPAAGVERLRHLLAGAPLISALPLAAVASSQRATGCGSRDASSRSS